MNIRQKHPYRSSLIAPIGERGNASGVNIETLDEREQRISELTWKLQQAWQEFLEEKALNNKDNTFNTKDEYLEALRTKDQLYIALGHGATMSCYPAAIVDGEEIAGGYHAPTRHDASTGVFVGFEDGSTVLSEQNSNHALLNEVANTHAYYRTLFTKKHSQEDTRQHASDFKANFVDIANTHAGGEATSTLCKVANKMDMGGVREATQLPVTFSVATMVSYAERTRYKHTNDYMHEEALLKEFLATLKLDEYNSVEGYLAVANKMYGGDMKKTYKNISAVTNMTGQRMPEGWRAFKGTADEFRIIEARLATVEDGVEGYIAAAEESCNGDMAKTYINISAVANMTGQRMPEGWQQFQGTADTFRIIEARLATVEDGVEGYIALADELYNGNMIKTYINISAVANMTGQRMPEGWQQFHGTTHVYAEQQAWLSKQRPTQSDFDIIYGEFCQKFYPNKKDSTPRINYRAICHMQGWLQPTLR